MGLLKLLGHGDCVPDYEYDLLKSKLDLVRARQRALIGTMRRAADRDGEEAKKAISFALHMHDKYYMDSQGI